MAIMAGRPVNQVERTTVLIFTHLFFQITIVLVIVIIRRFTSSFFSAMASEADHSSLSKDFRLLSSDLTDFGIFATDLWLRDCSLSVHF